MKIPSRHIISALVTALIMTAIAIFIENPDEAKSTVSVGMIVAVVILAMPIYDIDRWSIRKRTAMHAQVMIATVLPLLMISGWFELKTPLGLLQMVAIYVLFGLCGWTVGFSYLENLVNSSHYTLHS